MEVIETIKLKDGREVQIVPDTSAESPLTNDEAIKFVVLHNRYANPCPDVGSTPGNVAQWAEDHKDEWVEFPLFMYDHSGTVYQISETGENPFTCRWDSGRVGSVFAKRKEFSDPKIAVEFLCRDYTAWANGQCVGYQIMDEDGDVADSCWGFYSVEYVKGYIAENIGDLA